MNAKQISTMVGRLVEHQSMFDGLSTEIAQQVIQNPKDSISFLVEKLEKRGIVQSKTSNDYLRCISSGQSLIIPACDGQRIIAESEDVFECIDPDFRDWNVDERGVATIETSASVFEMKQNATFAQMFDVGVSSLADVDSSDTKRLRRMSYTQDQIIGFVENYRSWLRTNGYATFFPFESYGNFFVADVRFYSDGSLEVYVLRLGHPNEWDVVRRRRVVLPRLV